MAFVRLGAKMSESREEWVQSIFESEGLLAYTIISDMDRYEREYEEQLKWDRIKPLRDNEPEEEDWLDYEDEP